VTNPNEEQNPMARVTNKDGIECVSNLEYFPHPSALFNSLEKHNPRSKDMLAKSISLQCVMAYL